jgi:MFS family permease
MRAILLPLVALLMGTSILLLGNGLLNTLVPIRAGLEYFDNLWIGLIGAAYFSGFIGGCFLCPMLVSQVGHIRAFTAFAGLAAATPLLHVLWIDPVLWVFYRAITGACFAGLYMVIESWLNDRATPDTRGRIVSIYVMINMVFLAAGTQLMNLETPSSFRLFAIVGILTAIALVPVAMTRSESPPPPIKARPRIRRLISLSPVGFFGCVAVGLANGTFWAMGPVYARGLGFSVADIASFMSLTVIGGAVSQWPIGWLSDRSRDRRHMIIAIGFGAAAGGIFLTFGNLLPVAGVFIGAYLFGTMIFPLYGLCVAHANDYAETSEFVDISAGLLLAYGIGATAGPIIASGITQALDVSSMFMFTAIIHIGFSAYTLYRLSRRAPALPEDRDAYVPVTRTSATIFTLDPRAAEDEVEHTG